MSPSKPVILVTGSYKGIGLEVVKQLFEFYKDTATVYLTAREPTRAQEALQKLQDQGFKPQFHALDINDDASVEALRDHIRDTHGQLDVLINNAGMAYKMASTAPFSEQAKVTVETNYFGTLKVCDALFPLMAAGGRVVNVASGAGRLNQVSDDLQRQFSAASSIADVTALMAQFVTSSQEDTHKALGFSNSSYGMSKLGMIAAGRVHARLPQLHTFNMCPGWCKSDMAGWDQPTKTAAQGAVTAVWLATQADPSACNGKFFREKAEVKW
jgi:carbonyl reductase 1